MRRQDRLSNAKPHQEAHFRKPLQRGGARVRDAAGVFERFDIARREAAEIMGGSHEAVEIDFRGAHGGRSVRSR